MMTRRHYLALATAATTAFFALCYLLQAPIFFKAAFALLAGVAYYCYSFEFSNKATGARSGKGLNYLLKLVSFIFFMYGFMLVFSLF